MSKYTVEYSEKSIRQLKKMDKPTKKLITGWIARNLDGTDSPRIHGKRLTGDKSEYWRYRVGEYRIIADIRDKELTIVAVSIGHRRQVYKR